MNAIVVKHKFLSFCKDTANHSMIVYVPILVTDITAGLHYHSLVECRTGLVPVQESLTLEPGDLLVNICCQT